MALYSWNKMNYDSYLAGFQKDDTFVCYKTFCVSSCIVFYGWQRGQKIVLLHNYLLGCLRTNVLEFLYGF